MSVLWQAFKGSKFSLGLNEFFLRYEGVFVKLPRLKNRGLPSI
jgi:hypothetical protein